MEQNLEQNNRVLMEAFNNMSSNFAQATLDINMYKIQLSDAQSEIERLGKELKQLKGGK